MWRHCRHVGGQKQYIFSPLGNKIYHAELFHCFSPPTWLPWKPSIVKFFVVSARLVDSNSRQSENSTTTNGRTTQCKWVFFPAESSWHNLVPVVVSLASFSWFLHRQCHPVQWYKTICPGSALSSCAPRQLFFSWFAFTSTEAETFSTLIKWTFNSAHMFLLFELLLWRRYLALVKSNSYCLFLISLLTEAIIM